MSSLWHRIRTYFAAPDKPSVPEPLAYRVTASLQTDTGCQRTINEDSAQFMQPRDVAALTAKGVLAVVADGMGGHAAGDIASRLAVDTVSRAYYESTQALPVALREAFQAANQAIYAVAQGETQLRGMGTTCSALVLCNGAAYCAHVGDSRLYLVRDDEIYLMSEDDSAVMEMVRRGILSSAAARRHPDRNVILRALGTAPEVQVASWEQPFPVRVGDRFVLCSDGLSDLVDDDEIMTAVNAADAHLACEELIALARERGGHDNITVGVIAVLPAAQDDTNDTRPLRETRETEVAR
jgi:protein phosphatase